MLKKQGLVFLVVAFLLILVNPMKSSAEIVDLTGGIKNEYTYEEYVFILGQPMHFTATSKDVKVTVSEKKDKITETYKIKMQSTNGATLDRTVTYTYNVSNYDAIGQSTATGEVTRYSEKIKYQDATIELKDYQMSKSHITDKRPASDYTSGNSVVRKTYEIKYKGGQTQTVVVHGSGKDASYENFWGAAETQIMEYIFEYPNDTVGTVTSRVSHTKSRTLNYEENLGSLASFEGGYAVNSESDTISQYVYDLPKESGTIEFNAEYMPKVERLIVPKFRDLSAHWAKPSIDKLYSLGIFDDKANFFSPNTPMSRYDFAVAIGKAIDLRVEVGGTTKKKNSTSTIFKDVKRTRPNYEYLVAAYNKGVINGVNGTTFNPEGNLTRQQAAAIIVRALGMEGRAPDPGYTTSYKDDHKILNYARDGVYVITQLGIMNGSQGYFNPSGTLTRAQAAAIIERVLEYLENDLKQNYRDDILFFEY
ncbi:S-layer homology domain-containing protein [Lysinibacillus sp. LZ02]|uniref:S-layer homology domain-containing protein n=1 Tax=Lysinibacillus sp. LZ02 TaxID=3420668 RepID=UPI003D3626A4